MKKYTIRTAVLSALALALVLGASTGPSLSYFTTYVTAEGGYNISLQHVKTEVDENVVAGAKNIAIVNTGNTDCYVRVRLYYGSMVSITFSGEGWRDGGDGYYYYDAILHPGERTTELKATITPDKDLDGVYNVVVIEECTPVQYDEAGRPYADWTLKAEEG